MKKVYVSLLTLPSQRVHLDAETIRWRYARAIRTGIAVVGFNFKPTSVTTCESEPVELRLNSNRDSNADCDSP